MILPTDRLVSTLTMPVRYSDCDVMGIVHHSRYVVYLEDARLQFAKSAGVDYVEVMQAGIALAVVELQVQYKRALVYGDSIDIHTWLDELKSRTMQFSFQIQRTGGSDLIATARVSLICLTRTGTPTRIPETFATSLQETLPGEHT